MKKTGILLFSILCAVGCEQDQKQKPPPILLVDVRDENGFIPQWNSRIVTGVYTPYGNKKLTYLKWNEDPVLYSGQSIHMYLVDSPRDVDCYKREGNGRGFSLASVSLDQKPTDRAGNYCTPQQLKEMCESLSKAKEWSRTAVAENLNVLNKEMYSLGTNRPIISFTQERGATNYSVTINLAQKNRSNYPQIYYSHIILDELGVEHFIKAVDVVLEQRRQFIDARETANQEKADTQAQLKLDAEKANQYLK